MADTEERRQAEIRSIMNLTKSSLKEIEAEEKPKKTQAKKQTKGAKK